MKLLVIGPEVTDIGGVRNFSGMWSFYLRRELRAMGVELSFIERKAVSAGMPLNCDHILALGTRAFDKMPEGIGRHLMARMEKRKGMVAQIHDGPTRNSPVHVTFHIKPFDKSYPTKNYNCWVGWAADPELFYPAQSANILHILIDHPQLEGGEPEDYSQDVWRNVQRLVRSGEFGGFERAVVARIVDGGLEIMNMETEYTWPRSQRQTIPITSMANAYRAAHLFMVTHPESVGLTILETAMCGALPIVPQGAVNTALLNSVRSFRYPGSTIPWRDVLKHMNVTASAKAASVHTWDKVASRIFQFLQNHGEKK